MISEAVIRAYGSEERAIEEVAKYCSANIFPYYELFCLPKTVLMNMLREHEPNYIGGKFFVYGYGSKYKLFMPPMYRDSYYTIPFSYENMDTIDCLPYLYLEKIHAVKTKLLDIWKTPALLKKVVARTLRFQQVDVRNLRLALGIEYDEQLPTSCSQMKGLLNLLVDYSSSKVPKILDMQAGYGSLLLAALSLNCQYTGYASDYHLADGLKNMIADIQPTGQHRIEVSSYNELDNSYDIVILEQKIFNSPDWIVNELFIKILKAWYYLKPKGKLALIMHDEHDAYACEATNLFIEQLIGNSSYSGVIGIQDAKGKIFPVWIWEKAPTIETKHIWNPPISKRPFWLMYPMLKDKLIFNEVKGVNLDAYHLSIDRKRKINILIENILQVYPKSNYKMIINILSENVAISLLDSYPMEQAIDKSLLILDPWLGNLDRKVEDDS